MEPWRARPGWKDRRDCGRGFRPGGGVVALRQGWSWQAGPTGQRAARAVRAKSGGTRALACCAAVVGELGPGTGLDHAWRRGLGRVGSSWAGRFSGSAREKGRGRRKRTGLLGRRKKSGPRGKERWAEGLGLGFWVWVPFLFSSISNSNKNN